MFIKQQLEILDDFALALRQGGAIDQIPGFGQTIGKAKEQVHHGNCEVEPLLRAHFQRLLCAKYARGNLDRGQIADGFL